jgi:hypothetical protein
LTIVQTSNFRPIAPAINYESIKEEFEKCDTDQVDQAPISPKSKYKFYLYLGEIINKLIFGYLSKIYLLSHLYNK